MQPGRYASLSGSTGAGSGYLDATSPLNSGSNNSASPGSTGDHIAKSKPRGPTACDACRRRKVRCDRQKPCMTCLQRNLPCEYTLVETAAAAALLPPPLRCLPPAPRYVFEPDDSCSRLRLDPAGSNSSSMPALRPRRSVAGLQSSSDTSSYSSMCLSDSKAAADLRTGQLSALPPLSSLSSMFGSSSLAYPHHTASSSSSLSSSHTGLPPLPPLGQSQLRNVGHHGLGAHRPSLAPLPNTRSGSWVQVEHALPALDYPSGRVSQWAEQTSRRGSDLYGGLPDSSSYGDEYLTQSSRPGTSSRGLRRSVSSASISSLSEWQGGSQTPSLSMGGSRRSTSSDEDDLLGMPSDASPSVGGSPFSNRSAFGAGLQRSKTPGHLDAIPRDRYYDESTPSFSTLPRLNRSNATLPSRSLMQGSGPFPSLSTSLYPSATAYMPEFSRLPRSDGQQDLGSRGTLPAGHPGYTNRRPVLPFLPDLGGSLGSQHSRSPSLSSYHGLDSPGSLSGRRPSRQASYAGLSHFEGSGR